MPAFDTLTYNGIERALGKWGFDLTRMIQRRGNAKPDTWTGTIPVPTIVTNPIFAYLGQVTLQTNRQSANGADNSFSGGMQKFVGWRFKNPLKAKSKPQSTTYEFQGPWLWLERTQYLQSYKGVVTNHFPGEVVLNVAASPAITTAGIRFISLGDQIQAILQYVLDECAARGFGVPFKYIGRTLLNGKFNLDANGQAASPGINTDLSGAIYNQQLPAKATLTIDQSLYANFLKSEIVRPMSASDCLEKLLESSPRTNIAFDYSTIPPTCYVMTVDNLPAVTLPLFTGNNANGPTHQELDIQRRDDLVPDAVVVAYRILNSVGGAQEIDYIEDKAGPNGSNSPADPSDGPNVLIYTLDLQGVTTTFQTGTLDCEPLAARGGTQASKRAWWSSQRGGEMAKLLDSRVRFQDSNGLQTTIADGQYFYSSNGVDTTGVAVAAGQELTAADYAFYTQRLFRGPFHTWMMLNGNIAVKTVKVRASASMQFAEYDATSASQTPDTDASGNLLRRHNVTTQQHCDIELTNGISGVYSTQASNTPGEITVIGSGGIAAYLYNQLKVLQYEGSAAHVEVSFSNTVSMLNRLNFSGGLPEWLTMNAQIQDIEEDWGRKETRVRIGVSKHLTADQLLQFLNAWRFRRTWYNPQVRADNTTGTSNQVSMPVTMGQSNTVEGLENIQKQTLLNYLVVPNGNTPGTIASGIILDANRLGIIEGLN